MGKTHVVAEASITVLSALSSVLTNQLHMVSKGSLKRNGHKAMYRLVVNHTTQNFRKCISSAGKHSRVTESVFLLC